MSTITELIEELKDRRQAIDGAIVALEGARMVLEREKAQTSGPVAGQPVKDVTATIRELYPPVPPAAAPAAQARPLRRAPARYTQRRAFDAWVATRDEPFTVDDLPAALRPDRVKAFKMLANMKTRGRLRKVGWGIYQRIDAPEHATVKATVKATTPPPLKPPPAVVPRPQPAPPAAARKDTGNAQESPFSAVAIAVGRGFTGSFTLLDLSARLDGKAAQAAQFLNAWRSRDWIIQSGYGQFKTTPKFGT